MKYVYLIIVIMLSGCASPNVVLPPATESVKINPELLKPCVAPAKLQSSDTLLATTGQWFVSYKECSDKQKALAAIAEKAFNTSDSK